MRALRVDLGIGFTTRFHNKERELKAVIIYGLTMGLILFALFCGAAEAEEVRAGVVPPDTSGCPGTEIQVGIEIDVGDVAESLGAYSASLEWNPAVLEFVEISGGTSQGFTTLQSNQGEVSSGKLLFNQFNTLGTDGVVHIARATFTAIGEIGQTTALDLKLSTLTAAHTFTNLLPLLTIEDGLIAVVAPKIPDISLSAVSYDFGDVEVNSSASWTLVISNEGNAELSVSDVSSSDPQFEVSPISFNVAAAGGSQNVTVTFTPTSMGDKSGILTISSDDPDESTVTVSLSGRGLVLEDSWYDTGNTKWVTTQEYECNEDQKEQKEQEYRDYYCSGGSCTYQVTDTQWIDTGSTRTVNKPDGTDCGSDGWVDTGNTRWVTTQEYECKEDQKEQKEQEYRDYACSGGSCTYQVTDTRWVDTGNTRTVNKPDGTDCGSDGWVDTGNTRWVTTQAYECNEEQKEQKEQERRNYYCSGGSCTYEVTETQWVDTGNTRTVNKSDGTDCGSDGWVDTGNTRWVTTQTYECKEDQKKQKEQEYRDYSCSNGSCTYQVTDTQWVDTGATQTVNKPDGTDCGSDYYEDWVSYCDGDSVVRKHRLFHDFYCEGGSCKDDTSWVDDQLVENCNDHDGWYDTKETRWIEDPDNPRSKKEQKKQRYRDYFCSDASCGSFKMTDTKWTDTGRREYIPAPPSNVQAFDTPNDQGHSITLTWTKSPDDGAGLNILSYYRIYRSRSSEFTDPIPLSTITSLDSLIAWEMDHPILIDSVVAGTTEYVDPFVPVTGVNYYYWLDAVTANGAISAKVVAHFLPTVVDEEAAVSLPQKYFLYQNSPNPFNASTEIRYQLPEVSDVRLVVYDITGGMIRTLVHDSHPGGYHSVLWDGEDQDGRPAGSGIYLYRLEAGNFIETRKALLLR